MAEHRCLRQIDRLLLAIGVTLFVGTIAFQERIGEPWFQSFYRSVSIVLVVVGITIITCAGAVIVEAVAGGVVTGAPAERRRERAIHQLHDHFIICGHGRVGRRVAEEFRAAHAPFVVLSADRVVRPYTTVGQVTATC